MTSMREKILLEAAQITGHDRNQQYGNPLDNLGCQGELQSIFEGYASRNPQWLALPDRIRHAIRGSITMTLGKIARVAVGNPLHLDNFIDGAAYLAIAGEAAHEGQAKNFPATTTPLPGRADGALSAAAIEAAIKTLQQPNAA